MDYVENPEAGQTIDELLAEHGLEDKVNDAARETVDNGKFSMYLLILSKSLKLFQVFIT